MIGNIEQTAVGTPTGNKSNDVRGIRPGKVKRNTPAVSDDLPANYDAEEPTEDQDIQQSDLKALFQDSLKAYGKAFSNLREVIETCEKSGVTAEEMEEWAEEIGFAVQTVRNIRSQIKRGLGLSKEADADDSRKAENKPGFDVVVNIYTHALRVSKADKVVSNLEKALRYARKMAKAEKAEAK